MEDIFRNQTIVITGAAGSVGQELIRQLLRFRPAEIRMVDNNESELFMLHQQYQAQTNVTAYLGDVRDAGKVTAVLRGSDIIFHCAAYKHVFFSEYNPFESVQTNALGVKNVLEAVIGNGTKLMIFTSSDKAVNPTSVMGTSKLMGERLVTAANIVSHNHKHRFASVRFGNVVGSRGSVFHVFKDQIQRGGPVTVTDPGMSRFIMSLEMAARLVLEGAMLARGGEVLVTKMKVVSILDLAFAMIELLAEYYGHDPGEIEVEIIGAKPGEKMYEELITQEEMARSLELEKMFVVLPAFRAMYRDIDYSYPEAAGRRVQHPYNSSREESLSKEEIKTFLKHNRLLPADLWTVPTLQVASCAS